MVGTGFEDVGLGQFHLLLVHEVVVEERKLDLLPEEFGGVGVKANIPERVSISGSPAPVHPWPHDQDVDTARALRFDSPVHFERAEKVFRVKPAPHRHHRRLNLLQMRPDVARLPEVVPAVVFHHGVPEGHLVFEVLLVGVAERA